MFNSQCPVIVITVIYSRLVSLIFLLFYVAVIVFSLLMYSFTRLFCGAGLHVCTVCLQLHFATLPVRIVALLVDNAALQLHFVTQHLHNAPRQLVFYGLLTLNNF